MVLDLDGIELDDEVKKVILAKHEESLSGYVEKDRFDALEAKKEELQTETKNAKKKAREESEAAEAAKLEAAKKSGDTDSLNSSWQEKYDVLADELNTFKRQTVSAKKKDIATDFVNQNVVADAFSREAMTAEYAKRIDVRDGKTVVLDVEGNLTALSVGDLNKEFLASSKYHAHLVSTNASGGGAAGGNKGNGGAVDLGKMSKTELSQYANDHPDQFETWLKQKA